MNRKWIAIIILIFSVILSILSLIYIETICGNLIDELDDVIVSVSKKEPEKAKNSLQNVIDDFEKAKPLLNIFLGQEQTTEVRNDLNKAIFFINKKSNESAILYLQECKTDLNKIIVSNHPSISTIL